MSRKAPPLAVLACSDLKMHITLTMFSRAGHYFYISLFSALLGEGLSPSEAMYG